MLNTCLPTQQPGRLGFFCYWIKTFELKLAQYLKINIMYIPALHGMPRKSFVTSSARLDFRFSVASTDWYPLSRTKIGCIPWIVHPTRNAFVRCLEISYSSHGPDVWTRSLALLSARKTRDSSDRPRRQSCGLPFRPQKCWDCVSKLPLGQIERQKLNCK